MRGAQVWTLLKKELSGVIRDRKTMVTMLMMSLLLYPILFGVIGMVMKSQEDKFAEKDSRIIVVQQSAEAIPLIDGIRASGEFEVVDAHPDDARGMLMEQEIDAVVVVAADGKGLQMKVDYDDRYGASNKAVERLQAVSEGYKQGMIALSLQEKGLSLDILKPVQVEPRNISEDTGGLGPFGTFLPYILAIGLVAGSMQIGVEITAGEKERGTITTLLVSQLSRAEIALAKLLTVLGMSIFSVVLNLISLVLGLLVLIQTVGEEFPADALKGIGVMTLVELFAVMIPLGCMTAAGIVFLGTFARNSKEGNAYIMPLMFLMMGLGIASSGMDANVSLAYYAIPFFGPILAIKQVLLNTGNTLGLLLTVLTSLVYTAILIIPAVKLYDREEVLFRT